MDNFKHNKLFVMSLIAVMFSIISLFTGLYYSSKYDSISLTGYAIDNKNATVNVTIASVIAINFSVNNINFGSGSLYPNTVYAVLDTAQNSTMNGTWTNTNFTGGLILDNIGTSNVTLNIWTLKNRTDFLATIPGANPIYSLNVSNVEAGSCLNNSNWALGYYYEANKSVPGTLICDTFGFTSNANRIKIDIRLGIPYNSLNGSLSDVISATVTG